MFKELFLSSSLACLSVYATGGEETNSHSIKPHLELRSYQDMTYTSKDTMLGMGYQYSHVNGYNVIARMAVSLSGKKNTVLDVENHLKFFVSERFEFFPILGVKSSMYEPDVYTVASSLYMHRTNLYAGAGFQFRVLDCLMAEAKFCGFKEVDAFFLAELPNQLYGRKMDRLTGMKIEVSLKSSIRDDMYFEINPFYTTTGGAYTEKGFRFSLNKMF